MKVAKVSMDKDNLTASFTTEDVSIPYMNTLRRTIIDFVPTLAIENVEIRKNTSVLYDEVLAHRLGLLPITTEVGSYSFRVDGESGLGSECVLTLQAQGPGTVVAQQLQSKDAKAKPAQEQMPITKLLKGQEIEVEAKAILGRGVEHAKWSPGTLYYQYQATVVVNNKAADLQKYIAKFPPQVVKDQKVDKAKIEQLQLYDAVEGIYPEAVNVTYDSKKLVVNIESWGQYPIKTMVSQACTYITEALTDLKKAISTLK